MSATPEVLFRRYRTPTDGEDEIKWRFVCGLCTPYKARRGHLRPSFGEAAASYATHYDTYHITLEEATR